MRNLNKLLLTPLTALFLVSISCSDPADSISYAGDSIRIENKGFSFLFRIEEKAITANLEDKSSGLMLADGPMVYRVDAEGHEDIKSIYQPTDPVITRKGDRIILSGKLGGLDIRHVFSLPDGSTVMEENISLINNTGNLIDLPDFEAGFTRFVSGQNGIIPQELADDRWVAVPFRERPDDPAGFGGLGFLR